MVCIHMRLRIGWNADRGRSIVYSAEYVNGNMSGPKKNRSMFGPFLDMVCACLFRVSVLLNKVVAEYGSLLEDRDENQTGHLFVM